MKQFFVFVFLLSSWWASAFDGVVQTVFTSTDYPNANITFTWSISGDKLSCRMDYNDGKVNTGNYIIPDLPAQLFRMYAANQTGEKYFYEVPFSKIQSKPNAVVSAQPTGETKLMFGVKCEKYVVKQLNRTTEMWLTKDWNNSYGAYAACFQQSPEFRALADAGLKGFPLSAVTKDVSGKVISTTETISLQPIGIHENSFAVPSDYKKAEPAKKK